MIIVCASEIFFQEISESRKTYAFVNWELGCGIKLANELWVYAIWQHNLFRFTGRVMKDINIDRSFPQDVEPGIKFHQRAFTYGRPLSSKRWMLFVTTGVGYISGYISVKYLYSYKDPDYDEDELGGKIKVYEKLKLKHLCCIIEGLAILNFDRIAFL